MIVFKVLKPGKTAVFLAKREPFLAVLTENTVFHVLSYCSQMPPPILLFSTNVPECLSYQAARDSRQLVAPTEEVPPT